VNGPRNGSQRQMKMAATDQRSFVFRKCSSALALSLFISFRIWVGAAFERLCVLAARAGHVFEGAEDGAVPVLSESASMA